MLFIEPCGFR